MELCTLSCVDLATLLLLFAPPRLTPHSGFSFEVHSGCGRHEDRLSINIVGQCHQPCGPSHIYLVESWIDREGPTRNSQIVKPKVPNVSSLHPGSRHPIYSCGCFRLYSIRFPVIDTSLSSWATRLLPAETRNERCQGMIYGCLQACRRVNTSWGLFASCGWG